MTFATTKTCSQCGETKPSEEFHAKSRSTDGLRAECKACTKAYRDRPDVRERQRGYIYTWKRSPEHLNYMRRWRHENPERVKQINAKSRRKRMNDPELKAAWQKRRSSYQKRPRAMLVRGASIMVAAALRLGLITKKPCDVCGSQKSQAHHPDYARPLDVAWLCREHHMDVHATQWKRTPSGHHASVIP